MHDTLFVFLLRTDDLGSHYLPNRMLEREFLLGMSLQVLYMSKRS